MSDKFRKRFIISGIIMLCLVQLGPCMGREMAVDSTIKDPQRLKGIIESTASPEQKKAELRDFFEWGWKGQGK